ncbi:MAG: universal stress protein [Thermodesulfobacteriota bacterium]
MLWSNVLLAYDCSPAALKAVEYVGQMYAKVEGVKITILSIYEKVPSPDLGDSISTPRVREGILALERGKEKGRLVLEEAKKQLVRMGLAEDRITVKYVEKKKSVAKQIIDEVKKGGYGTVVLGRRGESNLKYMLFGSVAGSVVSNLTGASIVVVE